MTVNNPTVIHWLNGKTTEYDASDLPFMRKKNDIGGTSAYKYYNPNEDRYEVPKDIVTVDPALPARLQRREERKEEMLLKSASFKEREANKTPGHLRLHQHFSTLSA